MYLNKLELVAIFSNYLGKAGSLDFYGTSLDSEILKLINIF